METIVRLSAAVGIFMVMVVWEYFKPKRLQSVSRKQRWPVNLGLAVLNQVMMRLTVGGIAYWSAMNANQYHWGVLNLVAIPEWLAITITLLLLDVAIYYQHILMHRWPVLWRLHQVHHSDVAFDATTALRFHPLEIMLSMVYKVACIYLLGAQPIAVIAFEIILNGAATFNHSNISLPERVDQALRWLVITPDMHRIHHSTLLLEANSNYGFSVSWWDRLFKSYMAHSKEPQTTMTIGLAEYRNLERLTFSKLLLMPFQALSRSS